jgi:sugar phosphate isomerase/epimerase
MERRAFLKGLGRLYGSASVVAGISAATPRSTRPPLSRFKLGAISDGFSQDFGEALKMMKNCGLSWVEIRQVFGVYNTETSPAQIQRLKDLLDQYGFRVSVIDSALYKCTLPGTTPLGREKDAYPYPEQIELLKRAADRAHELGTDKIRGFTFWRVAEPQRLSKRIAEELEKAAEVAKRVGMRLVIENEETCTFAGQGQIDLVGQFRKLVRDEYRETMSLECEFMAPGLTQLETTRRSLEGLLGDMATALKRTES